MTYREWLDSLPTEPPPEALAMLGPGQKPEDFIWVYDHHHDRVDCYWRERGPMDMGKVVHVTRNHWGNGGS